MPLMFIPVKSAAQTCIVQSVPTASETGESMQGAYEAQKVGQIIPPKVGLCQDARKKTESHGDDGKGNENRVDRYQVAIAVCGHATHVRRDVSGAWRRSASLR